MNQKVTSAIIILSIATVSYAGHSTSPAHKSSYVKQSHFEKYFYVGVGASAMKLLNDGTGENFTTDGISMQVGYQYSQYLAFEARYTMSVANIKYDAAGGGKSDSDYPADFTNAALYLKPMYPIGDLSIYGLIGYGEVGITNLPKGDVDRAEAGLQLGAGLDYRVNNKISVFVDYTLLYDGQGFDNLGISKNHKASMVTFGALYNF